MGSMMLALNKCDLFKLQLSAFGARKQSFLYCDLSRLAQSGCVPEAVCWVLGEGEFCGGQCFILNLELALPTQREISSWPVRWCPDPFLSYTLLLSVAINKPSPLDSFGNPKPQCTEWHLLPISDHIFCHCMTCLQPNSTCVKSCSPWSSHTTVSSLWCGYCPKVFP